MSGTLHLIDIHYVSHGNTYIVVWIQIITKYIGLVFKLNGLLYAATILIAPQSWYNLVMTE